MLAWVSCHSTATHKFDHILSRYFVPTVGRSYVENGVTTLLGGRVQP